MPHNIYTVSVVESQVFNIIKHAWSEDRIPNDCVPNGCANHYMEMHPIWWSILAILGDVSVAANLVI